MLSFCLPTRKRPEMAILSLESIINNVDNWDEIDIMLGIDVDDIGSQTLIEIFLKNKGFKNYQILNLERPHYAGCFKYFNEFSKLSTRKWMMLWNDDIRLHTKNPNDVLKKYSDDILINPIVMERRDGNYIITHGNHVCAFPIIPKKWTDILGYISMAACSDTWVEYIARQLNKIITDESIQIINCIDRNHLGVSLAECNDEVYIDRQKWRDDGGPSKFWESIPKMNDAVEKLKTSFLITDEIKKIYKDVKGGFFVDINNSSELNSPLKFLEDEFWNGVCISNNEYYFSGRRCYVEPYEFDFTKLNEKNVYGYSHSLEKIAKHDKSNLMHVVYINCPNSIELASSLVKSSYCKAFEEEPTSGHWANQILFLIVKTNGNQYVELKETCKKYFIYLYAEVGELLFFKHEILQYEN